MLDKLAAASNVQRKLSRSIVDGLVMYASLQDAVDAFILSPTEDTATDIDDVVESINNHLIAMKNTISTLGNLMLSEDGEVLEIDAQEDEKGFRLK